MASKLFYLSIVTSIAARLSIAWESFWSLRAAEASVDAALAMASCWLSVRLLIGSSFPITLESLIKLGNNIVGFLIHFALVLHHTSALLSMPSQSFSATLINGVTMGLGLAFVRAVMFVKKGGIEFQKLIMELFGYVYIYCEVQDNVVILSSLVNALCMLAVELEQLEIIILCTSPHGVGAVLMFGALQRHNRLALRDCWAWFVVSIRGSRDQVQEILNRSLVKLRDARERLVNAVRSWILLVPENARMWFRFKAQDTRRLQV